MERITLCSAVLERLNPSCRDFSADISDYSAIVKERFDDRFIYHFRCLYGKERHGAFKETNSGRDFFAKIVGMGKPGDVTVHCPVPLQDI